MIPTQIKVKWMKTWFELIVMLSMSSQLKLRQSQGNKSSGEQLQVPPQADTVLYHNINCFSYYIK